MLIDFQWEEMKEIMGIPQVFKVKKDGRWGDKGGIELQGLVETSQGPVESQDPVELQAAFCHFYFTFAQNFKSMQAFIVDGVRTPIGSFGGSLGHVRGDDLAAHVIRF